MKKTLLPLILIATLLSNTAISYAQGNQPFWKINGNSNISSENFMGTINNQDLVIKTDNISRVIIQKNGLIMFKDKVIGEYPVRLKSKLTVDGTALFKDKVTFNGIGYFKNRLIVDDVTRLKNKLIVDSTALFKDKITVNGIGYFKNRLIVDDVTRLKSKLIVDSNAVIKGKIKNNYLSGSGIVLLKADNNGIIKKFPFPGDSTKVLRGDGTFSSFSAGITGSENNTVYFNTEGKQQESDALTNDGTYIKVKNGLTIGERSGATGQASMVVGVSAPEYGLAAPEASNLGTFAQGCDTKATGLASFSTGVSTKATGMASFSTGINTIASGESSFAGGHDDAGGNRFVVASGKGAFNYSAIGSGYIRVGAAAKNSAILGGKDHSIDTLAENSGIFCGRNNTIFVSPTQAPPMQTVIIGGENITATEPNTVYVPDLIAKGSITAENMNVTGQTVFDSLLVQKKITIGTNSMYLGTNSLGVDNNLWTDIGDMYIQSETGNDLNTIINANNKGFVGIGTNNPQQKLHIYKPSLPVKPDPIGLRIEKEDCGYWDMLVDTGSLFFTNIPLDPFIHSQLSLTKHGNVGIGTNNPQQKLHVNGNILIKGENSSLLFGDGETGTWGNWGIEYQDQGLNFWKPSGSSGGFANYILFLSDDGNVGVGTKNPHPDSRFNVVNYEDSKHRYAGYFISDFVSDEPIYGIFGLAMGSSHSNVGVIGKALTPCLLNYGVVGEAWNATERNYGGFFSATTSTSSLGGNFAITGVAINAKGHECTGLSSSARDARTNYGVKTSASGGLYAYGIYAGVGYASIEEWAGYFSGNVHATGDITWNSDIMMKKNIQNIENSLNIISQLNPKNFNFKVSDFPSMNLPNGLHYGLIAQQVDSVLPEIVCDVTHPAKYDSLGNIIYDKIEYKGINYISLIPILVQGIKQQQDTIKKLKDIVESYGKRFEHIDSVLVQCCSSNKSLLINNSDTNNNEINETEINSGNSILYQNRPNPFSKKTEINYYLSENVTQSSILVFNMQGILIKSYNLKTLKGNDKIVINGGELIPGIYIYALIVNNKEIDTKRMILTD